MLEAGFCGLSILDPLGKWFFIGWDYLTRSKLNLYELVTSAGALALLGFTLTGMVIDIDFARLFLLTRVFLFISWTFSFDENKTIYKTFQQLAPLFVDLIGFMTIIFFLFTNIGKKIVGIVFYLG